MSFESGKREINRMKRHEAAVREKHNPSYVSPLSRKATNARKRNAKAEAIRKRMAADFHKHQNSVSDRDGYSSGMTH